MACLRVGGWICYNLVIGKKCSGVSRLVGGWGRYKLVSDIFRSNIRLLRARTSVNQEDLLLYIHMCVCVCVCVCVCARAQIWGKTLEVFE